MKSVVIIGKGPSVERSTKEFIDSFDEVAICNYPIYDGYEHLISDHADWDFSNDTAKLVKIKRPKGLKHYVNSATGEVAIQIKQRIEKQYGLDPATGTVAFDFFANHDEYDKVAAIGFDLMSVGQPIYYYSPKEGHHTISRLYDNDTYSKDGTILKASGHNHDDTFEYMVDTIKNNSNKQFILITNKQFPEMDNLKVL